MLTSTECPPQTLEKVCTNLGIETSHPMVHSIIANPPFHQVWITPISGLRIAVPLTKQISPLVVCIVICIHNEASAL